MLRCVRPALTLAATLSCRTPFVAPLDKRDEADRARKSFGGKKQNSDHLVRARQVRAASLNSSCHRSSSTRTMRTMCCRDAVRSASFANKTLWRTRRCGKFKACDSSSRRCSLRAALWRALAASRAPPPWTRATPTPVRSAFCAPC